jgi:diguanylate cyclase (GGDEF)-like protein
VNRIPRPSFVLVLAIVATGAAVLVASNAQRSASDRAFQKSSTATGMLAAMLDQETGARGYLLTKREAFLRPWTKGRAAFERDVAKARHSSRDDKRQYDLVSEQATTAYEWRKLMASAVERVRRHGVASIDQKGFTERKRLFDHFRAVNAHYGRVVAAERHDDLRRAGFLSAGIIALICSAFGVVGSLLVRRQRRVEQERLAAERHAREAQAEFSETMQLMRDEREANDLVRRHLERSVPDAKVLVLNRNNSDDRLDASCGDPDLDERLQGATPDSCLAIRLARRHVDGPDRDPLLECEICGRTDARSLCVPSLVGGEVIGSVLIRGSELSEDAADHVEQTVAQAAPVLANLRNLAIAETRAATDSLTGLPNARSAHDTLKRMAAHAGRAASPLAAILLDLDHFKQINDRFGHGAGDNVLAAVGDVLAHAVRTSDFAARLGGEEFLALLPDTPVTGALQVAENLRERIDAIRVPEVDRAITASLGVAVLPDHAGDPETLLRVADRALYVAKSAGRDRVELADVADDDDDRVPAGATS